MKAVAVFLFASLAYAGTVRIESSDGKVDEQDTQESYVIGSCHSIEGTGPFTITVKDAPEIKSLQLAEDMSCGAIIEECTDCTTLTGGNGREFQRGLCSE